MQSGRTQQYGMELKYCERCGTLGLRVGGSSQVYCSLCEVMMSQVYRAPLRKRAKAVDSGEDGGTEPRVCNCAERCL